MTHRDSEKIFGEAWLEGLQELEVRLIDTEARHQFEDAYTQFLEERERKKRIRDSELKSVAIGSFRLD